MGKKNKGGRNEPVQRLPSGRIPKRGKPSKYGSRGKNKAKYDKNKERNAARKAAKKAALEAQKQKTLEEQASGAALAEHVQKGDLLAVAAPLASRKRAADFFVDTEGQNGHEREPGEPRKSKKPKTTENRQRTDEENNERTPNPTRAIDTATIPLTKEAAAQNLLDQIPVTSEDDSEDESGLSEGDKDNAGAQREDESDDDDQTAALIKDFESSDSEAISGDEGYEPGQQVPDAPTSKTMQRKLEKAEAIAYNDPGVIYVGRIPHGFYEKEMQAYFSQFGEVTRLRLSRNRKTGRSKHYAFVEFASSEVARIVAETMNNYLLFGHILKVQVVPQERIHEELWKGANRRFKVIPRNRMEAKALAKPKSRETWEKKIDTVSKKREKQMRKLKAMDYDFEPPVLKAVDAVPKRKQNQLLKAGEKVETDGGEAAMVAMQENSAVDESEDVETKKRKKQDTDKHKHSKEERSEDESNSQAREAEGMGETAGVPRTTAVEETSAMGVSDGVEAKKPKDKKHKDKRSKKEKSEHELNGQTREAEGMGEAAGVSQITAIEETSATGVSDGVEAKKPKDKKHKNKDSKKEKSEDETNSQTREAGGMGETAGVLRTTAVEETSAMGVSDGVEAKKPKDKKHKDKHSKKEKVKKQSGTLHG